MKKRFFALAFAAMLLGCYPDGADYTEELDIVYSNYDETYDFQSKGTYAMPDEIVLLTGDEDDPVDYIQDQYALPILDQIEENMTALGWTRVDVDANPDVELLPASWSTTTLFYSGGGYWCWWNPYYCGGWWYYPYPVVSGYTSGTLVMTMVDPNMESADGRRRAVWTGAINGLLSDVYSFGRVQKGVDQAFKQSPYLQTN